MKHRDQFTTFRLLWYPWRYPNQFCVESRLIKRDLRSGGSLNPIVSAPTIEVSFWVVRRWILQTKRPDEAPRSVHHLSTNVVCLKISNVEHSPSRLIKRDLRVAISVFFSTMQKFIAFLSNSGEATLYPFFFFCPSCHMGLSMLQGSLPKWATAMFLTAFTWSDGRGSWPFSGDDTLVLYYIITEH